MLSPIGWGMWRFRGSDVKAAQALVESALACGINFFDTADVYGLDNGETFGASEALLGKVFEVAPQLRQQMVLATKGGIELGTPYNSSAKYLIEACDASLRRMKSDRIELYQIHRPDILAHPCEIAEAFEKLRQAGKVAEFGVSNYTPAQTAALIKHLPFPLASIQPEFSPLAIEPLHDGTLDKAIENGLAVLAWSPFGGGRLAGKGADARSRAVIAALDEIAVRKGVSRSVISYAWILGHASTPIPLIGSQQPHRIREAMQAIKVELSRSEWYFILTAARGAPLP
jgi:predicted oxidoreductase